MANESFRDEMIRDMELREIITRRPFVEVLKKVRVRKDTPARMIKWLAPHVKKHTEVAMVK